MLPANVMGVGGHISPVVLPNSAALMVPTPGVTGLPAMHATAVPPAAGGIILLTCQPALNMGSTVPAAVNTPPTLVPPVLPQLNVMGMPTVLLGCLPATTVTSPAVSAGPPGLTAIPNVTTVFFMYAGPIRAETETGFPRVTIEDLRALERALSGPMVDSALLPGGAGYVAIRRFSSTVPSSVFHAVQALLARGMTSLLLDLRGNGGGEMDAFLQLAGDFLEEGSLIVTMTDADGDTTEYHARQSNRYAFPVALLVDSGTASAAEVFAGALQAHGRALVLGDRTYGKGEAQAAVPSPEGLIYATVASFTLPGGRDVQGIGIEPDLPLPLDDIAASSVGAGRLPLALRDAVASLCGAPSQMALDGSIG